MSGVLWSVPQSCGECGADAAFVRHAFGEALCRECGHEHPMSDWALDDGERFEWVDGVLFVTAYDVVGVWVCDRCLSDVAGSNVPAGDRWTCEGCGDAMLPGAPRHILPVLGE